MACETIGLRTFFTFFKSKKHDFFTFLSRCTRFLEHCPRQTDVRLRCIKICAECITLDNGNRNSFDTELVLVPKTTGTELDMPMYRTWHVPKWSRGTERVLFGTEMVCTERAGTERDLSRIKYFSRRSTLFFYSLLQLVDFANVALLVMCSHDSVASVG